MTLLCYLLFDYIILYNYYRYRAYLRHEEMQPEVT